MTCHINAGAAKCRILLPPEMFPYIGGKGDVFVRLHEDIFVRCIYIENGLTSVLLASVEAGMASSCDALADEVSSLLNIKKENIYIAVLHNYDQRQDIEFTAKDEQQKEKNECFERCVREALLKSCLEAYKNREPVKISYEDGECDININREMPEIPVTLSGKNPHGLSDKTVHVVKFCSTDNKVIALVVNYGVRSTVMQDIDLYGGMDITGDLSGYTAKYIEDAYDDQAVVLWFCGAAADQDPKFIASGFPFESDNDEDIEEQSYALLKAQARSISDEILFVASDTKNIKDEDKFFCVQDVFVLPQKDPKADFLKLNLGLIQLGNIGIICISGMPICKLGLMIKGILRSKFSEVILISNCNGSVSFLCDIDGFEKNNNTAVRSAVEKGYAENVLAEGVNELMQRLNE